MEKIVKDNHFEYKLHIGRDNNHIYLTAVITNITNDPVSFTTNMGSWCDIRLYDSTYDVDRLDSMLSTAAIKDWIIPPNKSISCTRRTQLPSEIDFGLEKETDINYTYDAKEYNKNSSNETRFTPNLDLNQSNDQNAQLRASLNIKFGDNPPDIKIKFIPKNIEDKKLDLNDYDLV